MFPYWVLFGVFAAGALAQPAPAVASRRPVQWLVLAGLAMALFVGLRWEVGTDWDSYILIFDSVRRFDLVTIVERRGDPGYYLLIWLAHRLGTQIWAVNLVCALIFAAGLIAFARRQPNPWLAVAATVPYLVIVVAMSGTRQATAIGLTFLALVAFSDRRLLRATLWLALAAAFHASAILMVGLAALSFTRNRLQAAAVLLVTVAVASFLLAGNIDIYLQRYANRALQSSGTIFRILMNLLPALVFLYRPSRFAAERHERTLWRNMALLALCALPAVLVVPSSTALDRASLYLTPLQAFVISRVPHAFARDERRYRQLIVAILAYLALSLFVFLNFAANAREWIPYRFLPLA